MIGERVVYCPEGTICVPNYPDEQVHWGPSRLGNNGGGELRVVVDRKVLLSSSSSIQPQVDFNAGSGCD
jgi:hypothetical protein